MFEKKQMKSLVEVTLAEGERVMTENKNLIRGRGLLSFLSLFMVIFLTQTTMADEKSDKKVEPKDREGFKVYRNYKDGEEFKCEPLKDISPKQKAAFGELLTSVDKDEVKESLMKVFRATKGNAWALSQGVVKRLQEIFSDAAFDSVEFEGFKRMTFEALKEIKADKDNVKAFGTHLVKKGKDEVESNKEAMIAMMESLLKLKKGDVVDLKGSEKEEFFKELFDAETMAEFGLVAKCEDKKPIKEETPVAPAPREKPSTDDNTDKPKPTEKPLPTPSQPTTPLPSVGEVQPPVCQTPNPGTGNNFDALKKYMLDALQGLKKQEDPFAALAQKLLNDDGKKDEGKKDDGNGQQAANNSPAITPTPPSTNDFNQPLTPQPTPTPTPIVQAAQIAEGLGALQVTNHHTSVDFTAVENGMGTLTNELASANLALRKADEALATTLNPSTACKNQIALAQSRPNLGRVANSCLLNVTAMGEQMRFSWKGQAANMNATADSIQAQANAVQKELSANPEVQLMTQSQQQLKQREDRVKALEKQLSDVKNTTAQVAASGADSSQVAAQEQRVQQALEAAKKDVEDSRAVVAKSEEVATKRLKAQVARLAELNSQVKSLRDKASELDSKANLAQTKMSEAESQLYALTTPAVQNAGPVSAKALLGGGAARPPVGGLAAARGVNAQPTTLGGDSRPQLATGERRS